MLPWRVVLGLSVLGLLAAGFVVGAVLPTITPLARVPACPPVQNALVQPYVPGSQVNGATISLNVPIGNDTMPCFMRQLYPEHGLPSLAGAGILSFLPPQFGRGAVQVYNISGFDETTTTANEVFPNLTFEPQNASDAAFLAWAVQVERVIPKDKIIVFSSSAMKTLGTD